MILWPDALIDALARRKAVIVIGSGVSRNSVGAGGKHPPTWKQFLDIALARLPPPRTGSRHIAATIKGGDFLSACEWLKNRLGVDWVPLLRAEFQAPAYAPSDFHNAIYKLDSRITLTPNFDKIYDTLAQGLSAGTVIVKTQEERDVSELLRKSIPVILKYHGTIDRPASMIFTRDEYARAAVEHASFYALLDALIMTHTFIFVGCGTSDPDVQLLLSQYRFQQLNAPPHYMILPRPVSGDVLTSLKNCYNLEVLTYRIAAGDDHVELLDSLRECANQVELRQQQLALELSW
jgi:hypothetical protein